MCGHAASELSSSRAPVPPSSCYGASGHAKVVVDCLKSMNERILAVFDDDREKNMFQEFVVIHDYSAEVYPDEGIIIAIGDNGIRKKLAEEKIRHRFGRAKHATAVAEPKVTIGDGTVVFHLCVIQSGTEIGEHVIINTAAEKIYFCVITKIEFGNSLYSQNIFFFYTHKTYLIQFLSQIYYILY